MQKPFGSSKEWPLCFEKKHGYIGSRPVTSYSWFTESFWPLPYRPYWAQVACTPHVQRLIIIVFGSIPSSRSAEELKSFLPVAAGDGLRGCLAFTGGYGTLLTPGVQVNTTSQWRDCSRTLELFMQRAPENTNSLSLSLISKGDSATVEWRRGVFFKTLTTVTIMFLPRPLSCCKQCALRDSILWISLSPLLNLAYVSGAFSPSFRNVCERLAPDPAFSFHKCKYSHVSGSVFSQDTVPCVNPLLHISHHSTQTSRFGDVMRLLPFQSAMFLFWVFKVSNLLFGFIPLPCLHPQKCLCLVFLFFLQFFNNALV